MDWSREFYNKFMQEWLDNSILIYSTHNELLKGNLKFQGILNWIIQILHHCKKNCVYTNFNLLYLMYSITTERLYKSLSFIKSSVQTFPNLN